MKHEIPAKVCASAAVRGIMDTQPANVTAVGLFDNCARYAFLSITRHFFLFVLFPNMWCSFILVIIPPFPFGQSSMLRPVIEAVIIPSSSALHGFVCACEIPTGHAVPRFDSPCYMLAWIPRSFHAAMLSSTPRSQPSSVATSIKATSGGHILFC